MDSKADTGVEINIKDLPDESPTRLVMGNAEQNGHIIALDPAYANDAKGFANTIAHEFGHNLGMKHGDELEAFATRAADAAMA